MDATPTSLPGNCKESEEFENERDLPIHVITSKSTVNCLKVLLFGTLTTAVLFYFGVIGFSAFSFGVAQDVIVQQAYVYYDYNEPYPDRTNVLQSDIMNSREYQYDISTSIYKDREIAIQNLVDELRILMNASLPKKDFKTEIYVERQYVTEYCGHQFSELRRRIVYDENGDIKENKTTIDINEDSQDKGYAITIPLNPSIEYTSEEKIEQDIHTTFTKYNRKTKIKKLDTYFDIKTCEDITMLFPNSLDSYEYNPKAKVNFRNDRVIWNYSYTSDKLLYGATKMKLSWTLYYESLNQALNPNATPTHSSEFSIRLYSPGNGMIPYQREILDWTSTIYQGIINFYT